MTNYRIYLITNLAKTKNNLYVGQTKYSIEQRFNEHWYEAKHLTTKHYDTVLHKAMCKYGIENFKVELLEDNISEDHIDDREIYYITLYDSFNHGYNMTKGGQGIHGYNHTEQTKLVLSKRSIATWDDLRDNPEKLAIRNKKISENLKGIERSAETKQKLSYRASQRVGEKNSFYGKQHSAETKNKIGLQNSKAVIAYDKITLGFVKEFISATEAMTWLVKNNKANNLNASMLIKSCKNKVKSAYGYVWKYKSEV